MTNSALSPQARADSLSALAATTNKQDPSAELDVIVVGGGMVGAGAALDAVSRGLSTALIEQRDLASGTSSRSSKLVHGGLRYLEMFDFALVREALEERGLHLTRLSPHLVKPVPFLYPLKHAWERPYIGGGLVMYDGLAKLGKYEVGVPLHKHLFKKQLARIAPDLNFKNLHGAVRYYDGQVDDARWALAVARTATAYGAHVATRTKVTGFLREAERVVGVKVRDLETDQDFEVRAKVVINAAGVWTDDIQELVGGRGQLNVQASKGVHIVVPRDRIRSECGFITKTEKSVLFVIPWGRHWLIGTTDTPWDLDKAHPAASKTDIDYLLRQVNPLLNDPLDHDDVEGVYAGLRPLLIDEEESTSKLSREHHVVSPVPGLVMIAGGKLTTYRVMAKDAVNAAARSLGGQIRDSITDRVPLVGAAGYETRTNQRVQLARSSGLHVSRIDHLLNRHGDQIDDLLAMVKADPSLGEALPHADDYLAVEVVYAVTHEGARHLDDVLCRRTRISIETFDRGVDSAQQVAELMGSHLGWNEQDVAVEVDHYLRRVEAERLSQTMATDTEADEARVQAPEIVT